MFGNDGHNSAKKLFNNSNRHYTLNIVHKYKVAQTTYFIHTKTTLLYRFIHTASQKIL